MILEPVRDLVGVQGHNAIPGFLENLGREQQGGLLRCEHDERVIFRLLRLGKHRLILKHTRPGSLEPCKQACADDLGLHFLHGPKALPVYDWMLRAAFAVKLPQPVEPVSPFLIHVLTYLRTK